MKNFKTYFYVFISIIISLGILVVVQTFRTRDIYPNEVYKVYIDGKFLGAIKSKKALEEYIDREQKNLKEEYEVKKVYIPNGIDIEKSLTYKGKIMSEKAVYKKIKEKKSFTIKGYKVTISKGEDTRISNDTVVSETGGEQQEQTTEEETSDEEEKIVIYITKKDIFDKAVRNFMYLFIGEDEVEKYANDNQPQIRSTGSIIENIYLDQDVSIKEALISTDETIYTTEEELTKFFSFNENVSEKEYIIEPGDTIDSAAFKNEISTRVFLIVNPEFTNANNLLKPGQVVNVARMNPVLKLAVEKHVVEDVDKGYKTIEKEDPNMDLGTQVVEVEGVNGISRQTEKVKYINGGVDKVYITNTETIKEPIDEVVIKGTKRTSSSSSYSGSWIPANFSGSWGWPSVSTYITTYYGYDDWHGGFHNGLDIALSGCYSPIFAIESGTVIETNSGCADISSGYGDYCGSGYGNYVWIAHPEGVYALYAHMSSNVVVGSGEGVSKGQVIGYMGSSGSSSACHLHFSTFYGGTQYGSYGGGSSFDPLSLYR